MPGAITCTGPANCLDKLAADILYTIYKTVYKGVSDPWTCTFCIQYTKLYTKVFQIHGPAHFVYNIQNCIQRYFESMAPAAGTQRCYILYTIYKTVYKDVQNSWPCWHAALLHFVYNIQNCIQRCFKSMDLHILYTIYKTVYKDVSNPWPCWHLSVATFCIQYTNCTQGLFEALSLYHVTSSLKGTRHFALASRQGTHAEMAFCNAALRTSARAMNASIMD
jgi:hypothetical protein